MLGKVFFIFFVFLQTLWCEQNLFAKELLNTEAGIVPYGMGRAYSAVADDWLALHYNPAGLAMVDGVDFQLFELGLGADSDMYTNYNKFKKLSSSGSDAQKIQELSGKKGYAKASNYTQLTLPSFAIGFIYDYTVAFNNRNAIYPQLSIRKTEDTGFLIGTGFGIGKGNNRKNALRLGVSLKYLKRKGAIKDITMAQAGAASQAFLDQFEMSGWGLGATVGMQYQLPISGRAEYTLSFVYQNIGDMVFDVDGNGERPTPIPQVMTAGFAMRFPIGGKVDRRTARRFGQPRSSNHLTLSADYSYLNKSLNKEHLPKHLHFGMNLDLPIISLQGGVNQTSFTYGFELNFYAFRIAAASYAEELGSYGGQQTDRRYLLTISSGFGFGNLSKK